MTKIDVLDKGYVRYVTHFGSDLDVVNNARVSFDRESDELSEKDIRLIKFLAGEHHMSPFRSSRIMFEVYAPLMICRQWWKHVVDSSHIEEGTPWNESSRRYITENEQFYIPNADEWRSYPDDVKQGSGEPINRTDGSILTTEMLELVDRGAQLYEYAMELGVAPEQARIFLPANGMYVRWRWTGSLATVEHLIRQRTADDAQHEFREYAKAVRELSEKHFPVSIDALLK